MPTYASQQIALYSNISRAMRGSARISSSSTFHSRNSSTSAFSNGTMPTDLRRLAEVRTIERNRRNRPTAQSVPGFLAQALEESIFHHIASLSQAHCVSQPSSLIFGHLLHGQVGGFGTLEDFVDVQRRAPVEIVDIGAIALHRHHLALGAGDRPWRGGNFRPQPRVVGFLSFAAGWGSHPGVP